MKINVDKKIIIFECWWENFYILQIYIYKLCKVRNKPSYDKIKVS